MELEGGYLKCSEEQIPTDEQAIRPIERRFRNVARLIPIRARNIEETITEQLTENIDYEINPETINELRRLVNEESQDEYGYPDQAG